MLQGSHHQRGYAATWVYAVKPRHTRKTLQQAPTDRPRSRATLNSCMLRSRLWHHPCGDHSQGLPPYSHTDSPTSYARKYASCATSVSKCSASGQRTHVLMAAAARASRSAEEEASAAARSLVLACRQTDDWVFYHPIPLSFWECFKHGKVNEQD